MACHNNLPYCQIKTAARTNFTGKNGLPLSEKTKKSFGSQFMTNRTFGKECWQGPLFNLCYPSSKSGRFLWRSGNLYSTKHRITHKKIIYKNLAPYRLYRILQYYNCSV